MAENIVLNSVNLFLDYALTIVGIMILYYIGKLIFHTTPEEEAEGEERRAGFKKYVTEKYKAMKEKEEKRHKKDLVSPAKSSLVKAIESCDQIIKELNTDRLTEIKASAKEVDEQIELAWRRLRKMRHKTEGAERDTVNQLVEQIEAIGDQFKQDFKDKLPKKINPINWKKQAPALQKVVANIRASCGLIFSKLEKYHL